MPSSETPQISDGPSWAAQCTLSGIEAQDAKNTSFLQSMASRCDVLDACVLACIRNECAKTVGGGCFHACGSFGTDDPERAIREFQEKTSLFCQLPAA